MRAALFIAVARKAFDQVPREVNHGSPLKWLCDWWQRIDGWITENRPGEVVGFGDCSPWPKATPPSQSQSTCRVKNKTAPYCCRRVQVGAAHTNRTGGRSHLQDTAAVSRRLLYMLPRKEVLDSSLAGECRRRQHRTMTERPHRVRQ
jgi:hypothetical protein